MRSFRCLGPLVLPAIIACSGDGDAGRSDTATSRGSPAAADTSAALRARADLGRILGDSTAPLWVVMVSDFQCPYCKRWHDAVFGTVKRDFVDRGRVRLAYINVPSPGHQHAQTTAELSLCAAVQGKFWEIHDALFNTQQAWTGLPRRTAFFDSLAASIGIDARLLAACMESRVMAPLVEADYQRAISAGVTATPTLLIGDSERLEGAGSIEAFRAAVDRAERSLNKPPPSR